MLIYIILPLPLSLPSILCPHPFLPPSSAPSEFKLPPRDHRDLSTVQKIRRHPSIIHLVPPPSDSTQGPHWRVTGARGRETDKTNMTGEFHWIAESYQSYVMTWAGHSDVKLWMNSNMIHLHHGGGSNGINWQ